MTRDKDYVVFDFYDFVRVRLPDPSAYGISPPLYDPSDRTGLNAMWFAKSRERAQERCHHVPVDGAEVPASTTAHLGLRFKPNPLARTKKAGILFILANKHGKIDADVPLDIEKLTLRFGDIGYDVKLVENSKFNTATKVVEYFTTELRQDVARSDYETVVLAFAGHGTISFEGVSLWILYDEANARITGLFPLPEIVRLIHSEAIGDPLSGGKHKIILWGMCSGSKVLEGQCQRQPFWYKPVNQEHFPPPQTEALNAVRAAYQKYVNDLKAKSPPGTMFYHVDDPYLKAKEPFHRHAIKEDQFTETALIWVVRAATDESKATVSIRGKDGSGPRVGGTLFFQYVFYHMDQNGGRFSFAETVEKMGQDVGQVVMFNNRWGYHRDQPNSWSTAYYDVPLYLPPRVWHRNKETFERMIRSHNKWARRYNPRDVLPNQ